MTSGIVGNPEASLGDETLNFYLQNSTSHDNGVSIVAVVNQRSNMNGLGQRHHKQQRTHHTWARMPYLSFSAFCRIWSILLLDRDAESMPVFHRSFVKVDDGAVNITIKKGCSFLLRHKNLTWFTNTRHRPEDSMCLGHTEEWCQQIALRQDQTSLVHERILTYTYRKQYQQVHLAKSYFVAASTTFSRSWEYLWLKVQNHNLVCSVLCGAYNSAKTYRFQYDAAWLYLVNSVLVLVSISRLPSLQ